MVVRHDGRLHASVPILGVSGIANEWVRMLHKLGRSALVQVAVHGGVATASILVFQIVVLWQVANLERGAAII